MHKLCPPQLYSDLTIMPYTMPTDVDSLLQLPPDMCHL